jgi:hypothetical protein
MEITGTEIEASVVYLEAEVLRLRRIVDALANKAKAAAEQQSPLGNSGGNGNFSTGQVVTAFGSVTGAGLASGVVRLQTVIGTTRYNKTDGTAGHYTDETVYVDVGTGIPVKTYVIYGTVDGLLRVFVAGCTAAASFSADDITA